MKFGRIVPEVRTHRLTKSDFLCDVTLSRWRPWRHFTQKSTATCWVHTQYLPSAKQQHPPVLNPQYNRTCFRFLMPYWFI